jgi:hypothetical protein
MLSAAQQQNQAVEILLLGDPVKALNPNARLHWAERAERTRDWRTRARLAWLEAGAPRFDVPVTLSFTVRRSRVLDVDNTVAALAPILNGLRRDPRHPDRDAMIPDDGPEWVTLGRVEIQTGEQYRINPSVTIRVQPVEAAS